MSPENRQDTEGGKQVNKNCDIWRSGGMWVLENGSMATRALVAPEKGATSKNRTENSKVSGSCTVQACCCSWTCISTSTSTFTQVDWERGCSHPVGCLRGGLHLVSFKHIHTHTKKKYPRRRQGPPRAVLTLYIINTHSIILLEVDNTERPVL